MEFVNPGFLYGLFAITIPIIIHLFNFRRFKKIYFTNVSFIRELKLQTQKQSRLKHLLILLMRILAVAAIVLAFAQPYFPVNENIVQQNKQNAVSIYIDNSFSMQAVSGKGTLLDEAKDKAREIGSVYKTSDVFQLITNDFEGRDQRFISKDEFLQRVDEVTISPVVKTLPDVISRQEQILKDQVAENKTSCLISDFQDGVLQGDFLPLDTAISKIFIPVEGINISNLYIDSCWFETPVQQLNQPAVLHVGVKNSSGNNYEQIPVKLMINGRQRGVASFDVKANEASEVVISYTNNETGIQNAVLEINDFAITFDDKLWFSYSVSSQTPVLCINGNAENPYLNSLFAKDSLFIFENMNEANIAFSDFKHFRLIILNELKSVSSGLIQHLVPFVQNGGSLIILPSSKSGGQVYNELLGIVKAGSYGAIDTTNTKVSYINLEHPLYSGVFDEIPENPDLPAVSQFFPITFDNRTLQEPILEMQRGGPFMSVFGAERGKVYVFAVPFDAGFSNFPRHAIFVPTLFKIAVSSVLQEALYFDIGGNEMISIPGLEAGNEEVLRLKDNNSDFEVIPERRFTQTSCDLFLHGQIRQAGNYLLFRDQQPLRGVSFNYSRAESEMVFYSAGRLKDFIDERNLQNISVMESGEKPFVQALTEFNQGIRLWKLFVVLALLFLLAEGLLLRFWK